MTTLASFRTGRTSPAIKNKTNKTQIPSYLQCHLKLNFFLSALIIVANSDDGWHIFVIGSASPRWC